MHGVIPLLPQTPSWVGAYLFIVSLLHNFTSFADDLHFFIRHFVVLRDSFFSLFRLFLFVLLLMYCRSVLTSQFLYLVLRFSSVSFEVQY
jgi:hypothetical protein